MALKIAPSLLAADFLHLEEAVAAVAGADYLHLDVMDGILVPNISFGFSVIDAVSKVARVPMDAHLMVTSPQKWFKKLADDGVSLCSFHLEAAGEKTSEYIGEIHSLGMKAGVAVNPDVDVEKLFPCIGEADFILLMSVFAGFGGQKFIPESVERVRTLKAAILERRADTLIEIDGGINAATAPLVREAGVDIAVAGSSVFGSADPQEAIAALRRA